MNLEFFYSRNADSVPKPANPKKERFDWISMRVSPAIPIKAQAVSRHYVAMQVKMSHLESPLNMALARNRPVKNPGPSRITVRPFFLPML